MLIARNLFYCWAILSSPGTLCKYLSPCHYCLHRWLLHFSFNFCSLKSLYTAEDHWILSMIAFFFQFSCILCILGRVELCSLFGLSFFVMSTTFDDISKILCKVRSSHSHSLFLGRIHLDYFPPLFNTAEFTESLWQLKCPSISIILI